MKDILVDANGDIVIDNNDLKYVEDANLTRQKVKLTLSTNKGEWLFNANEGIDFFAMLTKNPNEEQVYDTILDGLRQVDEGIQIQDYESSITGRKLNIRFTALDTAFSVNTNGNGVNAVIE